MNIRDYFVPEPGIYVSLYNYYYATDRLNDNNGKKVSAVNINPGSGPGVIGNLEIDLDVYALFPALVWVSPWKPLGAKYGAFISPMFANANVAVALDVANERAGRVEESDFGMGDLYVEPVWLGWTFKHWDVTLSYGFYAPVGRYSTEKLTLPLPGGRVFTVDKLSNLGLGFWTQQFQGGVAWYPFTNHATAITTVLTYEYNGDKEGFDRQPGQMLTFNWGFSQYLPLNKDRTLLVEIGPAGYSTWQITDSSGSDVRDPGLRTQVHSMGGQIGITSLKWQLGVNLHGFYDYAADNRFQGKSFGINLSKKF